MTKPRSRRARRSPARLAHTSREYGAGGGNISCERNDCAVRAFAVAACISYTAAHGLYIAAGRKIGHGTPKSVTWEVLRAAGLGHVQPLTFDRGERRAVLDPRGVWIGWDDAGNYGRIRWTWEKQRPTLAQFIAEHASAGHWLVSTGRHMLAVVDGVVHDWRLHPSCKVAYAVRLDV